MNRTSTQIALVNSILHQQVPDAELLSGAALARFGLLAGASARLPIMIAHSQEHSALFFIDNGSIDDARLAELKGWSADASYRCVFVSVFTSRKDYATQMDGQAVNTFVWFTAEPKHHLFISNSPETSAEFLSARFAAR